MKTATLGHEVLGKKVIANCEADDGHWFCATHDKHFDSNRERDSHGKVEEWLREQYRGDVDDPCLYVWVCHEHGPETAQ